MRGLFTDWRPDVFDFVSYEVQLSELLQLLDVKRDSNLLELAGVVKILSDVDVFVFNESEPAERLLVA